ncbi:MAG: ABC transporter permease [Chloroflexi bacterium]|nr:ABC transporter permease [Chloroflexota bacterium]MBI3339222.1 ABC transporter permease [Chloroflexota bacterium]
MWSFLLRRILLAIPMLLAISFVSFAIMQSVPGGPLAIYRNNPNVRAADLARLEKQLGLDKPMVTQYAIWLRNLATGNWGRSLASGLPVTQMISERIGNTFYLMGTAFILTMLIAIPIGVLSAVKRYSFFDHTATLFSFLGFSVPIFWLGLVAIIVFAVWLRWLPAGGMRTINAEFSFIDRLRYLILPASLMAFHSAAQYSRYVRASMLEVIRQDYITTARAKGQNERNVIYIHALRNALIPLITVVALDLPALFSGALLIETVFAWPGMGRLFWNSATRFDYPVLMGIIITTALLVIACNLIADVLYAFADPRVRLTAGKA